MKAIQKTKSKKSLSERVTAMEGDPRGAFATWGRRMAGRTRSIFIVLRHGILSLYSYIRKFVPWRSRTYIQNLRNIRVVGLSSSFLLGLLALAIIIPLYNVSGTEDTEAATEDCTNSGDSSLGTNCSITFTSTRNTATAEITPTANPVTTTDNFASSIPGATDAAFSIGTNNAQGYDLKISSSAGTTLKPSTTATLDESLTALTTSTGITKESTSFTNNTWGYLPSYYNSTANTDKYYPITTSTTTLRTTSSSNPTNTYDDYTIGIGAKVDMSRTAGTYTLSGDITNPGSITLSYVANPTGYEITYADNSGDSTVSNMPTAKQTGAVSATSIALAPNRTPTRTGYSLTGWCLGEVTSAGTSCSGTTIATNGSLAIDRTTSNSATLYAIWTPNKYTCTKQYRLQNADGSWGNYTTDTTEQVDYNSTCNYSKTVTNYKGSEAGTNDSAATTSATMNSTNGITVQVSLYRNTFSCYIQYRYQNADGSYGGYTAGTNSTLRYGQTCSWSRAADATYKAASYSTTISAAVSQSVNVDRNTFACKITYQLQNADGSYATAQDGTNSTLRYGQTCSWSRNADTTYKAASYSTTITAAVNQNVKVDRNTFTCSKRYRLQNANGNYPSSYTSVTGETIRYGATCSYSQSYTYYQTKSTSATITAATTLSLDLPRNTYALTINRNTTYISSVSGAGTYRWGQSVSISATPSSNGLFNGWSQSSGTTGTFGNTSSASTTFTMGKGAATIYADGKVIITIAAGSSTAMQNVSSKASGGCPSTLTTGKAYQLKDSRDNEVYYVARLADGNCWMLDNLRLGGTSAISLTTANTNSNGNFTLSADITSQFGSYTAAQINVASKNTTTTSYGSGSGKIGVYYNYCAASAGTYCYESNLGTGNASYDICPKGWRMPTGGSSGEYQALYTAYSSNNADFRNALSTPLSGFFDFSDSLARGQDNNSRFWSSTYALSYGMRLLYVDSKNVYPTDFEYRSHGYSVRCILK